MFLLCYTFYMNNKNKGAVSVVLSVLVLAVLAAGGIYYFNKNSKAPSEGENQSQEQGGGSVFGGLTSSSPKDLFLDRNTALYNAKDFEDMVKVSQKYDTGEQAKETTDFANEVTDKDRREAFFGFAQALVHPTSEYTDVTEEITGNTATVTAYNTDGEKTTATFVKVNGQWKMSDLRTLINPAK